MQSFFDRHILRIRLVLFGKKETSYFPSNPECHNSHFPLRYHAPITQLSFASISSLMISKSISAVPSVRVRTLNQFPIDPTGKFVMYWMTAYRRTRFNFALQRAVELANPATIALPLASACGSSRHKVMPEQSHRVSRQMRLFLAR